MDSGWWEEETLIRSDYTVQTVETGPLNVKTFSWSLKYLMYDFKLCPSYTYCNYFIILRKARQSDSHPAANSVQIIT